MLMKDVESDGRLIAFKKELVDCNFVHVLRRFNEVFDEHFSAFNFTKEMLKTSKVERWVFNDRLMMLGRFFFAHSTMARDCAGQERFIQRFNIQKSSSCLQLSMTLHPLCIQDPSASTKFTDQSNQRSNCRSKHCKNFLLLS